MSQLPRHRKKKSDLMTPGDDALVFNFAAVLPGRASSPHTERAYFRWIDRYLVDMADLKPTKGEMRRHRMTLLSVPLLNDILGAPQLRAWLGRLVRQGHGKQGIDQARAAVVTLADLLAEAQWLDDYTAAAMSRVRPPKAEAGQRPGRWLSLDELKLLMQAAREVATSDNQRLRNDVLATMLCTMALRREELSVAKWGDFSMQNNRVVLRVHGKGRKVAMLDVPKPVARTLERWRRVVAPGQMHPPLHTPLVRRIWKGGRIAKQGISPDGIWWVIQDAANYAGLGHVAPHDLRRSVAGALYEAEVPVDKISRLLRHSSVAITERYLQRLPHGNKGALLMSDLLELDDDSDDDWPGF